MVASKRSPSSTDSGIFAPQHLVEYEVHRRLQAHPKIKISSLVVRRIPSGVCLQGVVEGDSGDVDLQQLLSDIDEIETVVDHLVPCQARSAKT